MSYIKNDKISLPQATEENARNTGFSDSDTEEGDDQGKEHMKSAQFSTLPALDCMVANLQSTAYLEPSVKQKTSHKTKTTATEDGVADKEERTSPLNHQKSLPTGVSFLTKSVEKVLVTIEDASNAKYLVNDEHDHAFLSLSNEHFFHNGSSTSEHETEDDGSSSQEGSNPARRDASVQKQSKPRAMCQYAGAKPRRMPRGSQIKRRTPVIASRNPEVEMTVEKLDFYDHEGINLHGKVTVELDDEDFLRIVAILKHIKTGDVFVRGHRFRHTSMMNGMFDMEKNEVCWIQELDDDEHRPPQVQSMETVSVTQIIKRRRLRLTNQTYPSLNFRDDTGWIVLAENDFDKEVTSDDIDQHAPLACRTKFVRFYTDATARRRNCPYEKAVIFLRQDECDDVPSNKVNDPHLRQKWRGSTEKGGSQVGLLPGEKEFLRQEALSHAGRSCHNSLLIDGRKYRRGDIMLRGTIGDLLIRDDDFGVIYRKLSGVNDSCFTRSTLNVVTGEEVKDTRARSDEFTSRLGDGLHDVHHDGGVLYMLDEKRRPAIQNSSSQRAPEINEIDARCKKTTADMIFQHGLERGSTDIISSLLPKVRKRSLQEASPYPTDSDKTTAPNLRQTEKRNIDLTAAKFPSDARTKQFATSRSFEPIFALNDMTGSQPFVLTDSPIRSPPTEPAFDDSDDVKPKPSFDQRSYEAHNGLTIHEGATDKTLLTSDNASLQRSSSMASLRNNAVICRDNTAGLSYRKTATTKDKTILKKAKRRYTFGDCFCGAGGMSRGAVMAGLRVKWGFDFNDVACYSYALNFHTALVYHEQAHIFSTSKADQKVDICHMSFPCQPFSPAHTVTGQNDEMNTASFFAVGELLNKTRARVVVLEQTAGLINRHEQYFHTCVRELTDRGFSVRWKVINCANFGLPQRRSRLFMVASCPGEPLPPFAKTTHAKRPPEGSALKRWVSINEAIGKIPDGWANHDVDDMPARNELPESGDRIANCITTSGGINTTHPSGLRSYTHREFACLQGFPLGHKFGTMEIRKQIGNSVAPIVGKAILEEVVRALRETDEREESWGEDGVEVM